ncbi:MAG: hypothetical protein ACRYHA_07425 [Janthinobacterium lividum]
MPFFRGMTCCKTARVALGMECDYTSLLGCAYQHLEQAFDLGPLRAEKLLCELLDVFPPQDLLVGVRHIGCIDAFIAAAAKWCAGLPDKAQRHLFLAGFEADIAPEERECFIGLLTAEWKALRSVA